MSYNLVLNSSNVVRNGNYPYQYEYNFINGGIDIPENSEMTINQITIPYSWFSFSSSLGNNSITYYIPNSSNFQTAYTVSIPNSTCQVSDLNLILQNAMKANGDRKSVV